MKFRNEWKHEITMSDMITLRARLGAVAKPESHGINGTYDIRSLYFDDGFDTALVGVFKIRRLPCIRLK